MSTVSATLTANDNWLSTTMSGNLTSTISSVSATLTANDDWLSSTLTTNVFNRLTSNDNWLSTTMSGSLTATINSVSSVLTAQDKYLSDQINDNLLPSQWLSTNSYDAGSLFTYNGNVYQCNQSLPGNQSWETISSKVSRITVGDAISAINSSIQVALGNVSTDLNNNIENAATYLSGTYVKNVSGNLTSTISSVSATLNNSITSLRSDVNYISGTLITGITGNVAKLTADINYISGTALPTLSGNLTSVISSVSSAIETDVGNKYNTLTAQITAAREAAITSSKVTISGPVTTETSSNVYTVYQNETSVGQISIPHDVFVNNAAVSVIDGVKYLLLTLNNTDHTIISTAMSDLVDIYTGISKSGDPGSITSEGWTMEGVETYVNGNVISARIPSGAIVPTYMS